MVGRRRPPSESVRAMNLPFSRPSFLLSCAALLASALDLSAAAPTREVTDLPALVDQIVGSHPELKFYEAELAAARAHARAAGTHEAPELSFEVGRRRLHDRAGAFEGEGTTWAVSVTQTFDWPGRLALRKAVANHDVALAELGVTRFRAALSARAFALAHGLHGAATKAAALREVADRFAALKETFLARDPAGIAPLLETRVIEAAELALQRRATAAELVARAALVELNQLRGVPLDTPLRPRAARFAFGAAPELPALLAAARANNFEFRARTLELEQQGFAVRLAQHERRPSFSVSPYVGQARAGERETTYGVGVSLPLPFTARPAAAVDAAKARERQAEAALAVAERELERTVAATAAEFTAKSAEAQRWAADAVPRFRDSAALADRHYRLGAVPIATYVELQTSYLDAVEALLDTEREAIEAGLQLQLLTGLDFAAVQTLSPAAP